MLETFNVIASEADYQAISFLILKQLEGVENDAYYDRDGVATIGIGFNLLVPANLEAALGVFGFSAVELGPNDPHQYRARIENALAAGGTDVELQARLNVIMNERAVTLGYGRRTFTLTDAEMISIFDANLRSEYEGKVNTWLAGIPNSWERAILFSLAYGQAAENPLLGDGLKAAIESGDRAQAWLEIGVRNIGVRVRLMKDILRTVPAIERADG